MLQIRPINIQVHLQATHDTDLCGKQIAFPLALRITLWCPPLPANFLKRELPQPPSLRRVTLRLIGCLHMTSLLWDSASCRPQTQVYKPLFPASFRQFLDFSPSEQHIFVHDESSLCFLGLADLSIHKQQKTHILSSCYWSLLRNNHFLPSSCISRVIRITCLLTTYITLYHSAQLLLMLTGKAKSAQVTRDKKCLCNISIRVPDCSCAAVLWHAKVQLISFTDLLSAMICSHALIIQLCQGFHIFIHVHLTFPYTES